jgi:hypothetical protein
LRQRSSRVLGVASFAIQTMSCLYHFGHHFDAKSGASFLGQENVWVPDQAQPCQEKAELPVFYKNSESVPRLYFETTLVVHSRLHNADPKLVAWASSDSAPL